ncbi:MAG: ribonuclease H-like domain-containing protein [Candidatus Wallbacteria bacterium]|nr:ribonuclease H-like domain-containing protein [Candidatus Wallbacteria bacterium]
MTLSDRLRRIGALHGIAPAAPIPEPAPREELSGFLPCSNMYGTFLMSERLYPLEHAHGRHALQEALACEAGALGVLARDRSMGAFDVSRALFLDTETTGLSGGTGTVAFLVGVAGFEPGGFRVRQLFMRDFDEEPALLFHLSLLLEERTGIVTYNGKSFDVPLLATRFIANRLPAPELDLPHLDLLHTARRLWRHELSELTLASLERSVLAVMRTGDVPGMMIPALYFRFLTERRSDLLEPVFSHNLLDVLSLVSVLAAGARACRGEGERVGERYGVARTLDAMSAREEAVQAYRRALALCREPALERTVRKSLARALARLGNHDESAVEWRTLADRWDDLDALEALAKRAEHRTRDLAEASACVERALARLNSPIYRAVRTHDRRRAALLSRRERLHAKLARAGA